MSKLLCLRMFFFFSSRRRHTRYWRDWSSDVCSSDLYFKFGTPTHPASVDVFGINLYTYLMFGNCLAPDVPDGFTPNFISNYTSNIGSPPGTNHSTGCAAAPGTVG